MKLISTIIDIDKILLDPNNPRFFDIEDHQRVLSERYSEDVVQQTAINKLLGNKAFDILQLKESIKTNGYVPLEKIVVKHYDESNYIVVEGNRRIAAVKSIIKDYFQGEVTLTDEIILSLQNIEVLVLKSENPDQDDLTWDEILIQGIRHISGTKEWGAYQKARFVVRLKDEHGKDYNTISSSLGLGPRVTTRYYRTFKALKQMMDNEVYGEFAHPNLFTHFEEMIKSPSVKDWLGWDDNKCNFRNAANLETIYNLISETTSEFGDEISARLPAHTDIRSYSKVLTHDKAKSQFLSGLIDINQALAIANPAPPSPWQQTAKECLEVIKNLKIADIKAWSRADSELLDQILDQIEEIMKSADLLSGNNV